MEISQIAFDVLDHTIPFSSPNIKPLIKYNYLNDHKVSGSTNNLILVKN